MTDVIEVTEDTIEVIETATVITAGGGGVTDHGLLTGLADDDHTQYHTDARGDARYYTQAQVDAGLAGKEDSGTAAVAVTAHEADPTSHAADASQAEAEAGTEVARRWFSPLRIFQAIAAWVSGNGAAIKTSYEGQADTNAFTDSAAAKLAPITYDGVNDRFGFSETSPAKALHVKRALLAETGLYLQSTEAGKAETWTLELTGATGKFFNILDGIGGMQLGQNGSVIIANSTGPLITFRVSNTGSIFIPEKAAADADTAGQGQFWVKNTTPCELWYTDDAGSDIQLGTGPTVQASLTAHEASNTEHGISAFGATLVDDASAAAARTTLGVDAAGTDNSVDVTLAGTPDYITISSQVITRNLIDLTTDVSGDLPVAEGGTGASDAATARGNLGAAAQALTINNQTGTSYTLVLSDGDSRFVRCNNAAAITLTVPPNSSVAFAVGTSIPIRQIGAGAITLTPGSGVTLNAPAGGTLVTDGAGAQVQIVKVATNEWDVIGQTAVA